MSLLPAKRRLSNRRSVGAIWQSEDAIAFLIAGPVDACVRDTIYDILNCETSC
ncbi:hypothetical protein IQ235_10585 [Oscillatoriales cyanobacterium LEGE 11467]|uniref:Uncharacterized protein n=1 Tax=Zarconia navalis LEGE 11467 TaxID=1828826 RepID=A0A928W0U8_9CYAN|nr:hypothetical protein [Zarconia navalis]MBE9041225.1 hypothetical protein [Zarconia navalis LEGE 11467]